VTGVKKGFFISLEGGEGAGKSTQHGRIVEWLSDHGKTVIEAREPGGTPVSEQIRQVLLDTRNAGLNATAELLLMFAARSQLVQEVIQPALDDGKVIVCDRLGMRRVAGRGAADRFEVESVLFFERVRNAYLERAAANPQRFRVIDASQGEEQVWQQVRGVLEAGLGL
jgi:dTMP kinase